MALSHLRDPIGSVLGGRYRIVAPIGTGASARVFVADDLQLHRRVAVKVLLDAAAEDRSFLKRFRAEAHAAASINHPNVMHVYDFAEPPGINGGMPFLVVEFVGGGSLRTVLDECGTLTPSQTLMVGLEASRGLAVAHAAGLIHRDVKPANLLFGEEGRLRIADFGLARAFAAASWTEPEGARLGTPKYFSPEQATGEELSGRSDVYSLALVLVEALSGEVPFAAETREQTRLARCDGDMPVPDGLGRFGQVLARAGRLDPDLRPDAHELAETLMSVSESMPAPKPIPLPGAIPPEALSIAGTEPDDGLEDLTIVAAAGLGGAAGGRVVDGIDIPLDPSGEPAEPETIDATIDDRTGRPVGDPPLADHADTDAAPASSRARRVSLVVACVLLLLGGGLAYWWFAVRVPTHEIPDVAGEQVDDATRTLENLGFEVDVTNVRELGTTAGEVLEQSPDAGTSLGEGEQVELVASLGPPMAALPPFSNEMDRATAEQVIVDAGFVVGDVTEEFDEDVPAGFLVTEVAPDITEDRMLPEQSPVGLVISKGPAPRVMPSIAIGSSRAAAVAALEDVQLVPAVTEEFSEEPVGTVLAVGQAAGTELPRDTAVAITVSKGPAPIVVPDVIGMTGSEAAVALERAGFVVEDLEGSPTGEVLSTDPPVGESHPRGTAVRIFVRR